MTAQSSKLLIQLSQSKSGPRTEAESEVTQVKVGSVADPKFSVLLETVLGYLLCCCLPSWL